MRKSPIEDEELQGSGLNIIFKVTSVFKGHCLTACFCQAGLLKKMAVKVGASPLLLDVYSYIYENTCKGKKIILLLLYCQYMFLLMYL